MATPDSPTFPLRPNNRPALSHFRYRLGAYPDILDAMLRELNGSTELERWTHRATDDPGIALIESAAVVADILTFYQEHYANEAFLRTAQWSESVQELVRLTGYRLAPGIGGRASFALEVKGTAPVVVPIDFPIKADLANVADSVNFQTSAELTAYPQLGKFRFYRNRHTHAALHTATTQIELFAVGGSEDPDTVAAFDLKKGDKLMLVPSLPAWVGSSTTVSNQGTSQMVKVSKVTPQLGRLIVDIEGQIERYWSGNVTAYRVNRTFRHFGHNAPLKTTYQTGDGASMVSHQVSTSFDRHTSKSYPHECYPISGDSNFPSYLYTHLPINILPLDQEVHDLSLGAVVIAEITARPDGNERRIMVPLTIHGLQGHTMSWSHVNGPSTWIDIGNTSPLPSTHFPDTLSDLRFTRIHEATSPALSVRRLSTYYTGNFSNAHQLNFYGAATDAQPLVGRRVYLQAEDGRMHHGTVMAIDLAAPTYARLRQVTLDKKPKGFKREDFDEAKPTTDVFGNIVDVTQGKAETPIALGNGDARATFQTFKLPKTPLTYLLVPAATPSQVPELTIYVDGREWTRVESFYGRGPLEEVYIVRETAKGESYVQFGDGETGARLSSGIKNVVAHYRTGLSALGPIKTGTKPTAGSRLENLDKLTLAGEVSEGASAEDPGKARLAAPGKLQSLGRMVSLADYETETLLIAGVVTATASWEVLFGLPTIRLCVLLEQAQQSDTQFSAVEAIIRAADQARGPHRNPITVTQCELRYVYLSVTYAYDPALLVADVDAALRAALGLVADSDHERTGLFGLRRRRLGDKEYLTRIEGTLQNVPGILWCRVEHLGVLPAANDPTTLSMPGAPAKNYQVPCSPTELLQLHALHLTLTPATP